MRRFLSNDERKELESLKRDLVHPVKSFFGEVYSDTVGDAKKFYTTRARQAQQQAKIVQKKMEVQRLEIGQRREEQQRLRKAAIKRVAILVALLVMIGIVFVSVALSARAEEPELPGSAAVSLTEDGTVSLRDAPPRSGGEGASP